MPLASACWINANEGVDWIVLCCMKPLVCWEGISESLDGHHNKGLVRSSDSPSWPSEFCSSRCAACWLGSWEGWNNGLNKDWFADCCSPAGNTCCPVGDKLVLFPDVDDWGWFDKLDADTAAAAVRCCGGGWEFKTAGCCLPTGCCWEIVCNTVAWAPRDKPFSCTGVDVSLDLYYIRQ